MSAMVLEFELHDKQQEIFDDSSRFKVVPAGRRGGKSFYAAVTMIVEGLKHTSPNGRSLKLAPVYYVAPTYGQAKDIMWRQLKELAAPVTKRVWEKDLTIELINGRQLVLKGADNEETLRGPGLGYLVIDEYADMKAHVFDVILRPSLSDYEAPALFIGTPKGKNHFYDLYLLAQTGIKDMAAFTFKTSDNPIISKSEIELARAMMSDAAFRQEYEAEYTNAGSGAFEEDWFDIHEHPARMPKMKGSRFYMTVDLAGYADEALATIQKSALKKLDEHALVVAEVGKEGWVVHEVQHGRWGVRETSLRILRMSQRYALSGLGIEKGSLKNAIMPYLNDQMRRLGHYPSIQELTHGGRKKTERIVWALQGRAEHGRIALLKAPWNKALMSQLLDFPNPLSHDDIIDALAYIDQISQVVYNDDADSGVEDTWEPFDEVAGY